MHILAHTHTSTHISYMRKFIVTLIRTITTAIAITVIVAVGAPSVAISFPFYF